MEQERKYDRFLTVRSKDRPSFIRYYYKKEKLAARLFLERNGNPEYCKECSGKLDDLEFVINKIHTWGVRCSACDINYFEINRITLNKEYFKRDYRKKGPKLTLIDPEFDFPGELEHYITSDIKEGDVVQGTVVSIEPQEIVLNIGRKYDAYMDIREYGQRRIRSFAKAVKLGTKMWVKILSMDYQNQLIKVSSRGVNQQKNQDLVILKKNTDGYAKKVFPTMKEIKEDPVVFQELEIPIMQEIKEDPAVLQESDIPIMQEAADIGRIVSIRNVGNGKITDVEIVSEEKGRFLIGKKVGEQVVRNGRKYVVISIL